MPVETRDEGAPTVRRLLALSVPIVVVGVVSALVLYALDWISGVLQGAIWDGLPRILGVDPVAPLWILGVLTVIGAFVGLVIWFVPGHGGDDSATTELTAPPLAIGVLPSLALVAVLGLAGGVSLGPESPIIAINTGLLVWTFARLSRRIPPELIVSTTAAATIGAMFGTPVAAALVFTGMVASRSGGALWDRLFLPLVAAGAGSITMTLLAQRSFALGLPTYTKVAPFDLLSASIIATIAAALGVGMAAALPPVHRAFRLLRNPVLYVTAGGVVLGVLGIVGGPITLFKGLDQAGELISHRHDWSAGQLIDITLVKMVALLVAAAAGFRGGRIFPSVFIGCAFGMLAWVLVPSVPVTLAVGAGVLGVVLAVSRDGWISLFVAVAVTASIPILAVLCIAVLPAWLVVTRAPEMIVHVSDARAKNKVSG